jgi:response regulator RpfG family c-di-GMP phosphodiesterase
MESMKERILFVDDDPNVLEAYQRKLQQALHVRTAEGPHAGLRELKEKGPFAVVIADMNMPLMNGVEFLAQVREMAPNTVRMMLTGNADVKVAMQAVNDGNVFRFLAKPCPSKLMGESLVAGIKQYRLAIAEKELLEGTLNGTVELLTEILSWVNPDAFGRTLQLRNSASALAAKINAPDVWEIELAATLSQVGSMAIPQDILAKVAQGDPLNSEEQEALASVPAAGRELLKRIPRLDNVAQIVLYQSKRFDGNGPPDDETAGEDIPLGARILKVVSDFHELRASGISRDEALAEMKQREGWYDPRVFQAISGSGFREETPPRARRIVQVPLAELGPGLELATDITTSEGRKLVAAGTVVSEALLIRVQKFADVKGVTEPIEVLVNS